MTPSRSCGRATRRSPTSSSTPSRWTTTRRSWRRPGQAAEKARDDAVARGGHLVVVEGSVPLGIAGRLHHRRPVGGADPARDATRARPPSSTSAPARLTAASRRPAPNPTGAVRSTTSSPACPIVNLPGCPVNVDNLTATVVHFLTFGGLPATTTGPTAVRLRRSASTTTARAAATSTPASSRGLGRRGSPQGLVPLPHGLQGSEHIPQLPDRAVERRHVWPIGAGHGCVGCSEPAFWDTMTPFYDRLPHVRGART